MCDIEDRPKLPVETAELLAQLAEVLNKLEKVGWEPYALFPMVVPWQGSRVEVGRVRRITDVTEGPRWVVEDE